MKYDVTVYVDNLPEDKEPDFRNCLLRIQRALAKEEVTMSFNFIPLDEDDDDDDIIWHDDDEDD